MFNKAVIRIGVVVCVVLLATVAQGAPGLEVTKPPVIGPPNTGPPIDPPATMGQWFLNLRDGREEFRTHEFYDNVHTDAFQEGGGWASHLAIQGMISMIHYDTVDPNKIVGFELQVTITNDMPSLSFWRDGSNSHDEALYTTFARESDMYEVKLTVEFADDGTVGNFPLVGPPYWPAPVPFDLTVSPESNIFAIDYDELAWYCWTPSPTDPSPFDGQYMVPTYDFGDIPLGMSVTRVLKFGLHAPVVPGDALHLRLLELSQEYDILMNRTTSLKISDYFDLLARDVGIPYPHLGGTEYPPATSSNCSVFYNRDKRPEPPILDDVIWDATGLTLVWLGNPLWTYRVEASTNPYDYVEPNMAPWITLINGIPGAFVMSWTDIAPPSVAGEEKYYRIYAQNGLIEAKCPDTAGAMTIRCYNGRNLVSNMFEPFPPGGISGGGVMGTSTLDKMINGQLTGHVAVRSLSDTIEAWDTAAQVYMRAWYNTTISAWRDWYVIANAPVFGWDADVGYWVNVVLAHPDTDVTLCGRVSKVPRAVPIGIRRNLVGTCYPKGCTLANSGLVASGFIGHVAVRSLSDTVEFWNNATASYERFWYRTSDNTWQPWNAGDPMRDLVPGDAIWVNLPLRLVGFVWNYPIP